MLEAILQSFSLPLTPPVWAIDEMHRRIVLLLNHVLIQEPHAMERLVRQKGRVILMQWRTFTFRLLVSPAGLFDLAAQDAKTDLVLVITQESPIAIAQELMQGGKPAVRIEGDVQLAAEVSWLIDHVRWDMEEDLARLMGDAPAHTLIQAARTLAHGVKQFAGQRSRSDSNGSTL
jgi:ubiquinone biosynthesis protein UbiJ